MNARTLIRVIVIGVVLRLAIGYIIYKRSAASPPAASTFSSVFRPSAPAAPVPLRKEVAIVRPAPQSEQSQMPNTCEARSNGCVLKPAVGPFVVQLSPAERTEEDALSAFRVLQAEYPSRLGARQPITRLRQRQNGSTYYGVEVGPFASADDAVALCASLQSALRAARYANVACLVRGER
jgi:hypothetical protein